MTQFLPFQGIYYNHDRVRGSEVLAPPYDIISPAKQEELSRKSEYNIVKIDFGKELSGDNESENRYSRAARLYSEWLSNGILKKHPREAFFLYEAEYTFGKERLKLRGIIGRLSLVELGKGVYPHEETHFGPKADRLYLMRACHANVSPIFSLYNSTEKKVPGIMDEIAAGPPCLESVDDWEIIHRMWIIDSQPAVEIIKKDTAKKPVFIADGHHRYETALAYQREMHAVHGYSESAPYDFVMMFLVDMSDRGLTILPTHRLLSSIPGNILELLGKNFDISVLDGSADILERISGLGHALGMVVHGDDRPYVLKPVNPDLEGVDPILRDLDVTVLRELVFKKILNTDIITYEMNAEKCVDMVRIGEYKAAFFLNPTKVREIERVALNGLRMPPKSTYFYPKLLTGFVLNPFD